MKKITLMLVSFWIMTAFVIAQTPQAFKYQAVARTSSGNLIQNQLVAFRISILQGGPSGTLLYQERHTTNTNNYGLANLDIGNGTVLSGIFSSINWSLGQMYIKVELDPLGGTAYQNMGTMQLLSVPYALYSKTSGDGGLTLPYAGTTSNSDFAFSVTNSQSSAIRGQSTGVTGSSYGLYGSSSSASGFGVYGYGHTGVFGFSADGDGVLGTGIVGVSGNANSDVGAGVRGIHNPISGNGTGKGVEGQSFSSQGTGVRGYAGAATGTTYGVYGESASTNGVGVYGVASDFDGTNTGVYGLTNSSNGVGVHGYTSLSNSTSVGVFGETNAQSGKGIYGKAISSLGTNYGVFGESASSTGIGVYGKATASSGTPVGVYGESSEGAGIYGVNLNGGLHANGVYGITYSSFGAGVFGSGNYIGVYGLAEIGVWGVGYGSNGFSGKFTNGKFYVDGNVGIGTEAPDCQLVIQAPDNQSRNMIQVLGGSGNNRILLRQNSNGAGSVNIYDNTNNCTTWLIGDGWNNYINVNDYNLGIGTTAPTQKLDVNGNARFRAIGSGAYNGPVNRMSDGTLTTATSDGRLKENIHQLQNSLDKVMQLRGVSFTWKTNPGMGTRIGFIAQEFEQVIPELVFTNETDGFKGINYAEVNAVLVEAMKELNTKIDRLVNENEQMKAENEKINARLDKIEAATSLSAAK
jgi:hypothetical protein